MHITHKRILQLTHRISIEGNGVSARIMSRNDWERLYRTRRLKLAGKSEDNLGILISNIEKRMKKLHETLRNRTKDLLKSPDIATILPSDVARLNEYVTIANTLSTDFINKCAARSVIKKDSRSILQIIDVLPREEFEHLPRYYLLQPTNQPITIPLLPPVLDERLHLNGPAAIMTIPPESIEASSIRDQEATHVIFKLDLCRQECLARRLRKNCTVRRELKFEIARSLGLKGISDIAAFKSGSPAYHLISKMLSELGYSTKKVPR